MPSLTLAPLPLPSEMGLWDRCAIHEFGIREEILMENASREALHALRHAFGSLAGARVLLIMGGGNNGGDAAALARHLLDAKACPLVLHTRPIRAAKGACGYHVRLARRCGVPFLPLRLDRNGKPRISHVSFATPPDILVDGLLGTGFSGILRPEGLSLVQWMNSLREHAFLFALDIPSGLDGRLGVPRPKAVRAHATVTFEAAKPGLVMPGAEQFTGVLDVRSIGIPHVVHTRHAASCVLLNASVARLLPPLQTDMHKGSAGHVLVIGGSAGMSGAPLLAAQGAVRGGAGYVTVAMPGALAHQSLASHPELLSCPAGDGERWGGNTTALDAAVERATALVVGPGMGRDAEAGQILAHVLSRPNRPCAVLDADALYHLAHDTTLQRWLRADDVLTPHPGEMARLTNTDTAAIQRDRLAAAQAWTAHHAGVLVLKGAGTLIAQTGLPLALSPFAVPALAVAGSGDVLAGLLGALLARPAPPDSPHHSLHAAYLAVYWHGLAGKLLQHEFPGRGNSAMDIAHALRTANKELFS